MIRVEQKDLQPNVEYFFECTPKYNDNEPSKLRCVLVNHMSDEDNNILLHSFFRDVKPINPEKYPNYNCHTMSIITYTSTFPYTNNHFKFYQISQPIFHQKSLDRLYENAINLRLKNIIGDPFFVFE